MVPLTAPFQQVTIKVVGEDYWGTGTLMAPSIPPEGLLELQLTPF